MRKQPTDITMVPVPFQQIWPSLKSQASKTIGIWGREFHAKEDISPVKIGQPISGPSENKSQTD